MNQDPLYQARKADFENMLAISEFIGEPTEYGEPCGHPAGSLEKIAALRRRVERGQVLHHPSDDKTVLIAERRPFKESLRSA